MRALAGTVALFVAAGWSSAYARPLNAAKDRVGVTADGAIVVLTDLCNEMPSCRPNHLQVFSADGLQVAEIYRDGVPGEPVPKPTRDRLRRLYDQALVALG